MPGIPTDNLDPTISIDSELSYSKNKNNHDRSLRFRFRFLIDKKFILLLLLLGSILLTVVFSIKKEKEPSYLHFANLKASSPDFVGRKEQLKLLYKHLISEGNKQDIHSPVKIQVLWGKGGFGKSELAI